MNNWIGKKTNLEIPIISYDVFVRMITLYARSNMISLIMSPAMPIFNLNSPLVLTLFFTPTPWECLLGRRLLITYYCSSTLINILTKSLKKSLIYSFDPYFSIGVVLVCDPYSQH